MNNVIDKALGIHPHALSIGAKRLETLAANMANADTPHYKARDIDFRAALSHAMTTSAGALQTRHQHHIGGGDTASEATLYRTPTHPSLDGNTVDTQLEQAAFAEAAVRYQASLDFLSRRIDGLRKALRGD